MSGTIPGAVQRPAAVEGVRFAVQRLDPKRTRKKAPTPTLLLHGVPQTSYVWRDLAPELASDRIVVAPDLKGIGASEAAGRYDIATVTAELAALVLHEIDGPVDVVGHDWGGSLALGLATARPDLVRRVVIVSAPYRKVDLRHSWHMPVFFTPGLPEAAFRLGGRSVVRAMLRWGWGEGEPLDPAIATHYASAYASPAQYRAMLAYYREIARPRAMKAVTRAVHRTGDGGPSAPRWHPTEPSLVVWGAADPAMPIAVGEAVQRDLGAGAEMLTLPGVGHFPVDEAPDVVVPAIAEFLRR